MPDEQLQPILRELDTLKHDATAVLNTNRRPEVGEQLIWEARQNRNQPDAEARRGQQEVEMRNREEAFNADLEQRRRRQDADLQAFNADLEERRRRQEADLQARERELTGREKLVATREQELANREKAAHESLLEREQQIAIREQRLDQREGQLLSLQQRVQEREEHVAVREGRLADRETGLSEQTAERERRFAEREADLGKRWDQLSLKRDEIESRNSEVEHNLARLRDDEEKMREQRRQLEEREMRWGEACKEAHFMKHYPGRPRFSPRLGKENHELMRQLEEQQNHIQAIKREGTPRSSVDGPGELPTREPLEPLEQREPSPARPGSLERLPQKPLR